MIYRKYPPAWTLALFVTLGFLAGCNTSPESSKATATLGGGIAPVTTLVKRIAGEDVDVQTLIPPGRNPHTFEPTPRQIQEFGKVRVYFSVGFPFEKLLIEKIASHGQVKVVDIASDVRRELDTSHEHEHEHEHGSNCGCVDGNVDPHVWLSPKTLRQLALNIQKTLDEADPAGKAARQERCDALCRELDELDKKLTEQLKPYRGRTVYVFHPSLGYFCEAYGLKQKAIEAGGHTQSLQWLNTIAQKADEEGVRTIFVQKQFDQRAAKIVADAIQGEIVVIDPLAPDVIANLQHIADVIVRAEKR